MNEQTWLQRLDELIAAIHARVDADQNPILTERFQFEELQVLAFDLDVIDASIRRTNKLVFALDLFQYMQQRDALGQIIKNRPTVDGVANLRAIQARPTAGKPPTNSVGLAANSTRPLP